MSHVPPGGRLVPGPYDAPRLEHLAGLLRERVPDFGFVDAGPIPFTTPRRPLSEATVALVTTAGCHLRTDPPFRSAELALGDPTFRLVPHAAPVEALITDAVYVDARFVAQDPECAFPRRALDDLVAAGLVGAAAPRHATFVGGVVWPWPDLAASARELAGELRADGVDAVLLTPTCSLCVQGVAAIARTLETEGLATVGLSLLPELTHLVGAPRTLAPHFPFGAPCGDPGNAPLQRAVVREALALLGSAREPGLVRASRHEWRRAPAPDRPAAASGRTVPEKAR